MAAKKIKEKALSVKIKERFQGVQKSLQQYPRKLKVPDNAPEGTPQYVTARTTTVTIPHAEMDSSLVALDPNKTGGWDELHRIRAASGGTISADYPGLLVELFAEALEKADL